MYIQVTKNRFLDEMGTDNFSYEALCELYEYYEDIDLDMELDCIAINCDWSELGEDELISTFKRPNEDISLSDLLEDLREETTVIILNNGCYLVAVF